MSVSLRGRLATVAALAMSGCAPSVPTACTEMCAAGAALYGRCLQSWGLDWSAAGFADEAEYLASCETWAWEAALLHENALDEGQSSDADWLEDTCADRTTTFTQEDATCDDYTDVDWNAVPWSEASE